MYYKTMFILRDTRNKINVSLVLVPPIESCLKGQVVLKHLNFERKCLDGGEPNEVERSVVKLGNG